MRSLTFAFAAHISLAEYIEEAIHAHDHPKVLPVFNSILVVINTSPVFWQKSGTTHFVGDFVLVCARQCKVKVLSV